MSEPAATAMMVAARTRHISGSDDGDFGRAEAAKSEHESGEGD